MDKKKEIELVVHIEDGIIANVKPLSEHTDESLHVLAMRARLNTHTEVYIIRTEKDSILDNCLSLTVRDVPDYNDSETLLEMKNHHAKIIKVVKKGGIRA